MGSSTGGSGQKSGLAALGNPLGYFIHKDLDPVAGIAVQSVQNTFNWLNGDEQFGSHRNWFGEGAGPDFLNRAIGSETADTYKKDDSLAAMRESLQSGETKFTTDVEETTVPEGPRGTVIIPSGSLLTEEETL